MPKVETWADRYYPYVLDRPLVMFLFLIKKKRICDIFQMTNPPKSFITLWRKLSSMFKNKGKKKTKSETRKEPDSAQ